MNCQQAEKRITIAVYGTLNEEQESALKEHISKCQRCQRRWEKTVPLREGADQISHVPLPDPDRSWGKIAERLSQGRRMPARRRNWRWAPAAAVLLFVFAAGFFFGRRLLLVPPVSKIPLSMNLSAVTLETYADFLQPVLVNFINQDGVLSSGSMRRLERSIVSDLLARTRLLKSLIPEDSSSTLRELLQDLEFILTAIDNLEPGDSDTARHLAGLILDNEVSLRLRQFIKDPTVM